MKRLVFLLLLVLSISSSAYAIEPPYSPLSNGQVLRAEYLNSMFTTIYNWSNGIQATTLVTGTATFGLEGLAVPFTNATGSYSVFAEGLSGALPKIHIFAQCASTTASGSVVVLNEMASGTSYLTPSWNSGANLKLSYPASISLRFVITSY